MKITHFLLKALHAGGKRGITKGDHTHIYATVVKFTLSVWLLLAIREVLQMEDFVVKVEIVQVVGVFASYNLFSWLWSCSKYLIWTISHNITISRIRRFQKSHLILPKISGMYWWRPKGILDEEVVWVALHKVSGFTSSESVRVCCLEFIWDCLSWGDAPVEPPIAHNFVFFCCSLGSSSYFPKHDILTQFASGQIGQTKAF